MENCKIEQENGLCTLIFSRPDSLNALSSNLLKEVKEFLKERAHQEDLKILIITGEGDKSFAAGADIAEMFKLKPGKAEEYFALGQEVADLLETAPYITIAAVNGYALGGGLEMALGCDYIYAAERAKLGLPEVGLGLIPGFGGVTRLIEAIGMRKAKELIFSGSYLNADQAMDYGLVNRVFSNETLIEETKKRAETLLENDMYAVIQAKRAANYRLKEGRSQALANEASFCAECLSKDSAQQRIERFLEK